MDSDTIAELARRPLWSESELGYICLGINPDEHGPSTEPLNRVRENIRRAVLAKALACVCPTDATAADQLYGHARFFKPSVAAAWADSMGYAVPAAVPRTTPNESPPKNRPQLPHDLLDEFQAQHAAGLWIDGRTNAHLTGENKAVVREFADRITKRFGLTHAYERVSCAQLKELASELNDRPAFLFPEDRISASENPPQATVDSEIVATPPNEREVTITLPYITPTLESVFKIMRDNWQDFDPKRMPKQINIAREIDAALDWGNKGATDKDPSRSAKAIASIIKPITAPDD